MARIERFASRADAEIARSVLDDAGIPAYVSGDDAGGVHPEIPFGIGGTAVVVPDDRYDEALALLDVEAGGLLSDDELTAAALAAGDALREGGDVDVPDTGVAPTTVDAPPSAPRTRSRRRLVLAVIVVSILVVAIVGAVAAFPDLF